ncbi:Solute carrier family 22 member 1 [Portunus trituberculatus]|uniref:Solute carrier family 22 member 1 n=1 Tax=Portunus trituberculatus TaxID=210409 RepID=A0A5B7CW79_PORTR|nr:Solute carrier family 22 member 1 [Portunus trituberculatus]
MKENAMTFTRLPSVIFGVTSLVVCCLLALLPETAGVPLPDTVEDLNKLWRRKRPARSNNTLEKKAHLSAGSLRHKKCHDNSFLIEVKS